MTLESEPDKVRKWIQGLNDAFIGEVGISWAKYHAVIDDMKKFVKEQEERLQPEIGPF